MLIILIHNDGTGSDDSANYNCQVEITTSARTTKIITRGRVEGHRRKDGWRALLRRVTEELPDAEREGV